MHAKTVVLFVVACALSAAVGFAAGIYALPLLIAPPAPTVLDLGAAKQQANWSARFERTLAGSDALHWGEGEVAIGRTSIALEGTLAPGPDYRLYLSPEFVDTEAAFAKARPAMVEVGPVRTFDGFLVPVPANIDPGQFNTVVVWCESFGEFITAAQYQ